MVDDYDPLDRPRDVVRSERLADFVGDAREFWWIAQPDAAEAAEAADASALPSFDVDNVNIVSTKAFANCTLDRVVSLDPVAQPPATLDVAGGPILLRGWKVGDARPGEPLPLVLYWQAEGRVLESYTVFTQLLSGEGPNAGTIVAQQDNPPVQGTEPTDTWAMGRIIRDPYLLDLPADLPIGPYRLLVGMYNAQGERAPITLGAATTDAFAIDVDVK